MWNKIWRYINDRVDNDQVLPHADEIYSAFALDFDTGEDFGIVPDVMESYTNMHEIDSSIDVQWEEIA